MYWRGGGVNAMWNLSRVPLINGDLLYFCCPFLIFLGDWGTSYPLELKLKWPTIMIGSKSINQFESIVCCTFQPAFGCCALQTLVERVIFSIFCPKRLKKTRNLQQNFAKKRFVKVCTRTLVDCFKTKKLIFWRIKQ